MATILIVDDDAGLRDGLAETIGDLGHEPRMAATGREALVHLDAHPVDAVLLDLRMPGGIDGIEVLRRTRMHSNPPPVAVLTAFASAENTIEAMRLGAFDHLTKPIGREDLKVLLSRMLAHRKAMVRRDNAPEQAAGTLIGASEGMRRVQKTIGMASDSDATVLILGETGTGKELVARALHQHSRRNAKPFVAVNCAAIPRTCWRASCSAMSKAPSPAPAPTARARFGMRTAARCSSTRSATCRSPMQAKILRVLQERVVTPVGGKPINVDVRVVAATHRDLAEPRLVRCVPRRPALSVERRSDPAAATARALGRHRAAGGALPAPVGARSGGQAPDSRCRRSSAGAIPGRATCARSRTSSSGRVCSCATPSLTPMTWNLDGRNTPTLNSSRRSGWMLTCQRRLRGLRKR